jgi:hypothetical protein
MFITLTDSDGKAVYVNMDLVISVAAYDGERHSGPWGKCRSVLMCGGSGNTEGRVLQIHVQEPPDEIIDKVKVSRLPRPGG